VKRFIPTLFIIALISAVAGAQGIGPSTGSDPRQVDVDVNNKVHIVLRTPAPRDWNNVTVEINETWRFTLHGVPRMSSVCINAAAFTMRGQGPTVYFDPTSMNVKKVTVAAATGTAPIELHSVSNGMIKSLTRQQASGCLNAAKTKDAK
jgi:hypothetical protein